MYMC